MDFEKLITELREALLALPPTEREQARRELASRVMTIALEKAGEQQPALGTAINPFLDIDSELRSKEIDALAHQPETPEPADYSDRWLDVDESLRPLGE